MAGQIELIEGSTRDHSKSQFFTPPKLAQRLVDWAGVCRAGNFDEPYRVLEPSAGNGAIVRPLLAAGAEVYAVEIDPRYFEALAMLGSGLDTELEFGIGDFLTMEPGSATVDLACGNFPFHLDLAGEFTSHALEFAPRVCAIYPANFFYSETREKLWTHVRPTRIAHIAKRPWPGATDYVALELVRRSEHGFYPAPAPDSVSVEWWFESWG